MTPDELAVLANLDRKPATIAEIATWTALPRRSVEHAIQMLRRQGKPIASGPEGVWLTENPAELRQTEAALRRRYVEQALTVRAIRQTRRKLEEPQTLWDLVP